MFETPGNPMIYAELAGSGSSGLVVHLMYDTWPVTESQKWTYPPFEGTLAQLPQGRAIVGRGTLSRRGPLAAFLWTLRAFRAAGVPLPVNLYFMVDGNESDGSPHMAAFYEKFGSRFQSATATVFPSAYQLTDGTVSVRLGTKGMLVLELSCGGRNWGRGPRGLDLNWAEAAWVDSPIWRLTRALATLTTDDGSTVTIDNFYENVQDPTEEDVALLRRLPISATELRMKLDVARFANDVEGDTALARYLFAPALVLQGVSGSADVIKLHATATARLYFRLAKGQKPDEIVEKVRRHFASKGFGDIAIAILSAVPFSHASIREPLMRASIETYRSFGAEPQVWPFQQFTSTAAILERPRTTFGLGHGGNELGADEYLLLEDKAPLFGLPTLMRCYGRFLYEYARANSTQSS